jgi:hypothetical protein
MITLLQFTAITKVWWECYIGNFAFTYSFLAKIVVNVLTSYVCRKKNESLTVPSENKGGFQLWMFIFCCLQRLED